MTDKNKNKNKNKNKKGRDYRKPKGIRCEKVGCYIHRGFGFTGFEFFDYDFQVKDGDKFVYNKGILWRENRRC